MRTDTTFYKGILKKLKKKIADSEGAADKSKALSNLYAQKALALQAGNTKAASLIQRIITLLEKK